MLYCLHVIAIPLYVHASCSIVCAVGIVTPFDHTSDCSVSYTAPFEGSDVLMYNFGLSCSTGAVLFSLQFLTPVSPVGDSGNRGRVWLLSIACTFYC